jgi:beta-lactam-binding protein with PASTA domain
LVLVTVALLSALVSMRLAIHGREVAVPDFEGKTPAEARHIAEESGLGVQVEREYYSATIPEGRVLSQMPPSGSIVRRGWEVRVALSAGPQRVAIPQVVGDSERAADIAVAQRGLQLGVSAAVTLPGATPGQVVAQDPPANATDASAPKISLLVAATPLPEAFVMPSFIGQPLGTVTLALKDAGFEVGRVTNAPAIVSAAPTPPIAAGSVAAPQSGTNAPSTGELTPASPVASTPPTFVPSPAAIIVSQEPAPGQKVFAGSAINFVVR